MIEDHNHDFLESEFMKIHDLSNQSDYLKEELYAFPQLKDWLKDQFLLLLQMNSDAFPFMEK